LQHSGADRFVDDPSACRRMARGVVAPASSR
jgi:hypothetical protein